VERPPWSGKYHERQMDRCVSCSSFFLTEYSIDIKQDPTFAWHLEEDDNYTLGQWLNLNSFVARLFGSGIFAWQNFPIWQLRKGLEDDLAEAKVDCS